MNPAARLKRFSRSMAPRRNKAHIVLTFFCVLLSACSSIEDRQARVRGVLDEGASTASGVVSIVERQWHALWAVVSGVITFGQDTAANVQQTVQEVEHRVQKVQKGVEKIQEGRELLEEGLQGGVKIPLQ